MINDNLVRITRIEDSYVLRLDPESIVEIALVGDVTKVTYYETPEETVTAEVYEDVFRVCHRLAKAFGLYGCIERKYYGNGCVRLPLLCETFEEVIEVPAYLINSIKYDVEEKLVFVSVHSQQGAYLTVYCVDQDFMSVCAKIAYALGFKV